MEPPTFDWKEAMRLYSEGVELEYQHKYHSDEWFPFKSQWVSVEFFNGWLYRRAPVEVKEEDLKQINENLTHINGSQRRLIASYVEDIDSLKEQLRVKEEHWNLELEIGNELRAEQAHNLNEITSLHDSLNEERGKVDRLEGQLARCRFKFSLIASEKYDYMGMVNIARTGIEVVDLDSKPASVSQTYQCTCGGLTRCILHDPKLAHLREPASVSHSGEGKQELLRWQCGTCGANGASTNMEAAEFSHDKFHALKGNSCEFIPLTPSSSPAMSEAKESGEKTLNSKEELSSSLQDAPSGEVKAWRDKSTGRIYETQAHAQAGSILEAVLISPVKQEESEPSAQTSIKFVMAWRDKRNGKIYLNRMESPVRADMERVCISDSPIGFETFDRRHFHDQEKIREMEACLEWLEKSSCALLRANDGFVIRKWTPFGSEDHGRGSTILSAIRSAMKKSEARK